MPQSTTAKRLTEITAQLRDATGALEFADPVAFVYRPLEYAWLAHKQYIERYGATRKRVLFLGMNPGPFGMMQTGIPFGEVDAVTRWLRIDQPIEKPAVEAPKRAIDGYECSRSEVSGRRLWGLFEERFGTPEAFFADHWVANYCPLVFLEESARNRTPDKLKKEERDAIQRICDRALSAMVELLQPQHIVGVGDYAFRCAQRALTDRADQSISRVLHPSPASPAANRGWAPQATKQLLESGVWPK